MKKTISINIAGIVFHIEEDGFEKLNAYLKAIQKYFASYEGSKEIVEDIEARIAEKFWDKQKSDETQIISLEDVEGLMTSMGSVSDFAAIEEEEDLVTVTQAEQNQQSAEKQANRHDFKHDMLVRKFYRDTKRKLLGGVCAGLAHNLGFDPLWIRLAFLFLLLGIGPITAGVISGIMVVFYIACWIAFPANIHLEEDEQIRKFYRNPSGKVLGGVISGIAAYTGWDLGMLRFVSVLSILLFGSGFIIYIILWAIAPEAKSLTDKMQMTGEPITLENIEYNIKKTLHSEDKPEDTITRLLLLPFRVISQIFKALGPFANFLLSAGRVFIGGTMVLMGVITIGVLFIALFVGMSGLENANVHFFDIPVGFLARDATQTMVMCVFLLLAVPAFVIAWAGISLVSSKNRFTPIIWQSLLGVFLIGSLGSLYSGIRYAKNFAKTASVEQNTTYTIEGKVPFFNINYTDLDHNAQPSVELIGYDGKTIRIEKILRAQGQDKIEAEKNALDVIYNIVQKDSVLIFDDRLELKDEAHFRAQNIRMKIYVPFGKSFSMTREFAGFIDNVFKSEYFDDSEGDLFKGSLWKFTPEGALICENRMIKSYDDESSDSFSTESENTLNLDVKNFDHVKIKSKASFDVEIQQGNEYKVEFRGMNQLKDLVVKVENNTLVIDGASESEVYLLRITMPTLKAFALRTGKGVIKDFVGKELTLELADASDLEMSGQYDKLNAKLSGVSKLSSYDLTVKAASIEVTGTASAEINVNEKLEAKTKELGQIHYRGEPSVTRSVQEGGVVEREQ